MKAASSFLSQVLWNHTGKVYHRQQHGDELVWRPLRNNCTGLQHMPECSITKSGHESTFIFEGHTRGGLLRCRNERLGNRVEASIRRINRVEWTTGEGTR